MRVLVFKMLEGNWINRIFIVHLMNSITNIPKLFLPARP
jgi:hypothetical protein